MEWIFPIVVVDIAVYDSQAAVRQASLARERHEARKQLQAQMEAFPVAQRRAAALSVYLASTSSISEGLR